MSFKPTNEKLIDFVYGNLPETERLQIEQAINEDASIRAEVEALNGSRSFLHNLEDEEVLEPERLIWELTSKKENTKSIWPILAVAASLTLLLLVAYATQFRVSYGAFELAFGNTTTVEPPPVLTDAQVQNMIDNAILSNNIAFVKQLDNTKSEFEARLAANNKLQLKDMKKIAASSNELPKEQVDAYLEQLSEANRTMVNDFFEASALEQQDYIQAILSDFFEYVDKKRMDDFNVLQVTIKEAEYRNDLKTDQVLSVILTEVNTSSTEL